MVKKEKRPRGRPKDPKAQKRIKFTTKIDGVLLRKLKAYADKKGVLVNQQIEEWIKDFL